MKHLIAAAGLIALAGCAGMDWDANDKRVGYTGESPAAPATDTAALSDPVTGERVNADSEYKITHEGNTYYFSGRESMEKFQEDPVRYSKAVVR